LMKTAGFAPVASKLCKVSGGIQKDVPTSIFADSSPT